MLHFALVYCCLLVATPLDGPTPEETAAYQSAAEKAGRDALAHIRLASWCEVHGMQIERHKHLGIALEIAPDHPAIHGLNGQVFDNGEWRMPQAVVEDFLSNPEAKATLALYRARRDKSPDTAQAHWQLAQWCEENGLKAEAHLTAVVRLNPAREEAWKKLGFRKQKGRWMTAERAAAQRTEIDLQHKADAHWYPLLEKWNGWLSRKSKRDEAESALAQVHDPRAVPSVWKVFMLGGQAEQERAVRLLRQIDAPASSRALATLAMSAASASVRQLATEVLVKRDPREFATVMISVLRDPIVYEVRQVQGPGNPGELYVHGAKVNSRFFYEAPPPLATLRPTDIVGYDNNGLPVANRVVGFVYEPTSAAINPLMMGAADLSNAPQVMGHLLGPAGTALGQQMLQNQRDAINAGNTIGVPGIGGITTGPSGHALPPMGAPTQYGFNMPLTFPIPVGQLMIQAQQKAASSRAQLMEDVAALDRYNRDVNDVNDRAILALSTALLEKQERNRKAWVKWLLQLAETSTSAQPRPRDPDPDGKTSINMIGKRALLPAFGAGTSVWSLTGLRPIEAIRTGDQALTQDAGTGALGYTPVLAIHHGSREPIKKITVGDDSIETTDLERFWVAGKGWVTVADLKPGDAIRSLNGLRRFTASVDVGLRPVYHVQVQEGRGIVVGQSGILAHDERPARSAASPFDSAAITEASRSAR